MNENAFDRQNSSQTRRSRGKTATAGERRLTLNCDSVDQAAVLKGRLEDGASIFGKRSASALGISLLYQALVPPHTELVAPMLYNPGADGTPPWRVLDLLSSLSEEYAASAGLSVRDDRGLQLISWAFSFALRSGADYDRCCTDAGYVISRLESLGTLLDGDAGASELQRCLKALRDGSWCSHYELYRLLRLLRDNWNVWHGHEHAYGLLAVILRNSITRPDYEDTPADRWQALQLYSDLYEDCHRANSEVAAVAFVEPRLGLLGCEDEM